MFFPKRNSARFPSLFVSVVCFQMSTHTPTAGQQKIGEDLAPHVLGLMSADDIAKMLSIVYHADADFGFGLSVQFSDYAKNPKKRKKEAKAADGEEEAPKKKRAKTEGTASAGRPSAEVRVNQAKDLLKTYDDEQAPKLFTIYHALVSKFQDAKDKTAGQEAYKVAVAIDEHLRKDENPDDLVEIKDAWKPYDTYEPPVSKKKKKSSDKHHPSQDSSRKTSQKRPAMDEDTDQED